MIFYLNEIQPIPWLLLSIVYTHQDSETQQMFIVHQISSTVRIYLHHTPNKSPYYRHLVFQRKTTKLSHQLMCWFCVGSFRFNRLLVFFGFPPGSQNHPVKCIPVTPRNDLLMFPGHWTNPTSFHGPRNIDPFWPPILGRFKMWVSFRGQKWEDFSDMSDIDMGLNLVFEEYMSSEWDDLYILIGGVSRSLFVGRFHCSCQIGQVNLYCAASCRIAGKRYYT